ncbi:uncharacterized protein LOC135500225 [Lineus longissimus]|uniref:uncharacterized protein LOC135500225 n=1 Tax=Lineus longissimus TaxID=88925 RepID=UPI00315C9733
MKLWFFFVLFVAICGNTLAKTVAKACKHQAFSNDIPVGKTVIINCPKGYKAAPGAPGTLKCNDKGELEPDVSKFKSFCDPKNSCRVPWKVWFSRQAFPTVFKPGQYVDLPKAMCTSKGFEVSSGLLNVKMQLKCEISGKWNVDVQKPPCLSKTCSSPELYPHSTVNFNSQIAQYTCSDGYTFTNGKKLVEIGCVNKKWKPMTEKCVIPGQKAAPATEETEEDEQEETTTTSEEPEEESPEETTTEEHENEGNNEELPEESKDEETEDESDQPAVATNIADPSQYQALENKHGGGAATVMKIDEEEEEEEEIEEVTEAIEDADECEVKALETMKNRLFIPLTYRMVRSAEQCQTECEISDTCAAVGVILYEKIPSHLRPLLATKIGPKDVVCVIFVNSLLAAFIGKGPMSVLNRRSTYSFLYEKVCKPANITSEPEDGESNVCPGVGRKPTRVDQYYTISGAAGATVTVNTRDKCEARCMTDLDCTAMWYKPQLNASNCQLYHGKTTLAKPKELTFTKNCDTTGVCEMKASKYKISGEAEPMGQPNKLDECKHRCVSENWCKGVRWIGNSKRAKCHFLIDSKPKFEKNLITVYPCKKLVRSNGY